jgi:outer membrane protein assembly factor BamB
MAKNKIAAALIALIIATSLAAICVPKPQVTAEVINGINYDKATADAIHAGMHWDLNANASATRLDMWNRYHDAVPTWVFAVISPDPVGVGQEFTMVIFNPQVPFQSQDTNDIRYKYHVVVTKPSGGTETLPSSGSFVSDSTGTTFAKYSPTETGNYSVKIVFEELYYRWTTPGAGRDYYGVTLQSSSRDYSVTVQQEPVHPTAITSYPLPTEYWSRPIEGQENTWGAVSSNWLNSAADRDYGSPNNRIQTQGTAPNSGHILWTKPTEDGGVVGGNDFNREGQVFNAGHQYQTRFSDMQIIMHGRVVYNEPITWAGTGGDWVCVDLKTGEEVWRNHTMSANPSFGWYLEYDDMNQHGVVNPGTIFSSNFGTAIHPRYGTTYPTGYNFFTGQPTPPLNITAVPSGTAVRGPNGEQYRYMFVNEGNSTLPKWRLFEWNSSRVFSYQTSGTINASLASLLQVQSTAPNQPYLPTWDFNITVSTTFPSNWNPTIRQVVKDDYLLCSNGSLPTAGTSSLTLTNAQTSTLFAISLKPGEVGRMLWMKNFDMTYLDSSNQLIQKLYVRAGEGVFVMQEMPTLTWVGYDVYTGNQLWRTDAQADIMPFGYYTWVSLMNVYGTSIYDGKLITTGYTGHVFCYDLHNGTLIWSQAAPTGGEIFEYYTLFHGLTADGKVFIGTHEHSADTPLLKGAKIRVYDLDTGEEVWSMLGWAHPGTFALGDGVLTYWNNYDHQVYAVGKGASSTLVEVTNDVVAFGSSVVIKGNVLDISPGTKLSQQAMRFPNGVPAVADESMSAWMEYVYMQKPRPADVVGVKVEISVLDANNNLRPIGTATADADGFFSLNWQPDIPGKYTVYASFGGSESYWPSHATTAFAVDEAVTPATPEPTKAPTSLADQYLLPATGGIIAAIAVVGAVIVLMLRKK